MNQKLYRQKYKTNLFKITRQVILTSEAAEKSKILITWDALISQNFRR